MHYLCLGAGPDFEAQLAPFAAHIEVPRYQSFLEQNDVELMAAHFEIAADDLHALAAKMPEWENAEGGVADGRLFRWSTANPQEKYDWYEVVVASTGIYI